jgi:hypothetical protein
MPKAKCSVRMSKAVHTLCLSLGAALLLQELQGGERNDSR